MGIILLNNSSLTVISYSTSLNTTKTVPKMIQKQSHRDLRVTKFRDDKTIPASLVESRLVLAQSAFHQV